MEKENELKKVLQLSIFLSISVILQMIETLIIIPVFIPGIKLGLANIVIIIVLYTYGFRQALKIGVMRVLITGIMRSGFGFNFIFSIVGVLMSILVSNIIKKQNKLSIIGVSIVGANFHILGQIIVASFIYKTKLLYFTYLPYMLFITIISGGIIGYIAKEILEKVEITRY